MQIWQHIVMSKHQNIGTIGWPHRNLINITLLILPALHVLPHALMALSLASCILLFPLTYINPQSQHRHFISSSPPHNLNTTASCTLPATILSKPSAKKEETTMISTKKFSQMAKKWERMADLRRKRVNLVAAKEDDECCTSVAPEGHCVVYSADGRRFSVPLTYLGTNIFAELLRMSQEEFGFRSNGRITLPCNAAELEYVMCLLRRNVSEEVERAFLSSVLSPCHCGNGMVPPMGVRPQVAVSSF